MKIRLSNNQEIPAKIINIIEENEKERVIILEVKDQIKELTNYRKISFDLMWWDASGLKVPNQAIVQENDLDYVVRNRAGYFTKVLVKVKRKGEKYSIIEDYSNEELKELGFSDKDINSYRKLSVYDEILNTPNLKKIE